LDAGHVRVYENIGNTWIQIGDDIDGAAAEDWFGRSLSLSNSGNVIAIGAMNNDSNGNNAGQVSVYQNNTGIWEQMGNSIDGETAGDNFGYSVCLNNNATILAVGAFGNDTAGLNSGQVKVYQYEGANWNQFGETIYGESALDYFGESVSINSNATVLAVSAPFNDTNGNNSGQVRVYSVDNLGLTDLDVSQIIIFPNPTKGMLEIKFPINTAKRITFTDILGKTLLNYSSTHPIKTIDITTFKSGIYYCYISFEDKSLVRKIIKQ
jgi:hypothetical protein